MLRKLLSYFTLPLLLLLSNSSGNSAPHGAQNGPAGFAFNPGPDIITGDIGELGGLEQFGSSGTQVGLGVSTTSCNAGSEEINFLALPNTDHPVIPHNLYRMSGGSGHDERFEQIGQSWVKHAFGADQFDTCGFGCTPADFTHLGVGCSDTYANFQNADSDSLGSRALVNPFTGAFQSTANNHGGHAHTDVSHKIVVERSDLNTTLNPGATYYVEVQYITPHETAWCESHPGECNMYNNTSYRQYGVSGTTNFSFIEAGNTVRMTPAINAWPGATITAIEPVPGVDGRAFIGYKVTNPSIGVWHYEYALYNENLDRGIQSFSIPLGCGITLSNLGFHAPANHPGYPNDGTVGGAGFSNAAWTSNQTTDALSWSSETFAQNQNANAIRWGTLYNFRFDSDKPPITANATIGFFKTGKPVTVAILGPNTCDVKETPTPSPTPGVTATPSATPGQGAQAVNLSTRIRVQTGDRVGIGGFIITGTVPKQVLLRGIGPSLTGFGSDALADPVLELHGPPGFVTIINDNWDPGPGPLPTPPLPLHELESEIDATLDPGAYTAILKGSNNTSGVGLLEIYDFNQEVPSKLANLSTRAFVSTGNDIVIAGFILGNNAGNNAGNDRIVVRGLGPSLIAFGVPDALANPGLELRDSSGNLVMSNNDWQDDAAQAAELTAAGLAPTSNLESGISATLPPGAYTGLLSGVNSGTGLGLIEVYDLGSP